MSNNSAAKATLDVYQALFSALDDYLSRTRFRVEASVQEEPKHLPREVVHFYLLQKPSST